VSLTCNEHNLPSGKGKYRSEKTRRGNKKREEAPRREKRVEGGRRTQSLSRSEEERRFNLRHHFLNQGGVEELPRVREGLFGTW